MAELELDVADVGPALQEVRRVAVPQPVRRDELPEPRSSAGETHEVAESRAREPPSSSTRQQRTISCGAYAQVRAESFASVRPERHEAIFPPFALPDVEDLALEIDVREVEQLRPRAARCRRAARARRK